MSDTSNPSYRELAIPYFLEVFKTLMDRKETVAITLAGRCWIIFIRQIF